MTTVDSGDSAQSRDVPDIATADTAQLALEASPIDLRRFDPHLFVRMFVVVWIFTAELVKAVARLAVHAGALRWQVAVSEAIRTSFIRLGPTFVKLGQMIASSSDLFPETLSNELESLLERVPPFPSGDARELIEEDLGCPLEDIFASFEMAPLASASIAQVHGCILADGRDAVVKIQRPGLRQRIDDDLRLQYRLARVLDRTKLGSFNPVGVVEDLNRSLHEEMNFLVEAHYQERFRRNIAAFGDNENVMVPEVYGEWCSTRVLCMERVYGQPFESIDAATVDVSTEALLRRAVKVWTEAAYVHGLFHGDVHGGNMFLLDDGRVCFLDFGIVGTLSPVMRRAFAASLKTSALDADWVYFVETWRDAGLLPEDLGPVDQAAAAVAMIFAPMLDQSVEDISIGDSIDTLFKLNEQFGQKTDENLILVSKQLVYFERYGRRFAPHWKMARDLYLIRNIFPDEVAEKAAAEGITFPD